MTASLFWGDLPPIKRLNFTEWRDNLAVHCFVLEDLIPIYIFKQLMIFILKICTTGKILVKFVSRSISTGGPRAVPPPPANNFLHLSCYLHLSRQQIMVNLWTATWLHTSLPGFHFGFGLKNNHYVIINI